MVKSKKQMRNIFIRRIENILMCYYKEINFDLLVTPENGDSLVAGEEYRLRAMELIDLMEELGLVNRNEYLLISEVYGEHFGLHQK